MKTKSIAVLSTATRSKSVSVDASILGQLAVHCGIGSQRDLWVVSHIDSGAMICCTEKLKIAKAAAIDLEKLDWSKVKTIKSKKAIDALASAVMKILRKHGFKR